jgi:tetratricopeptide (TPR) repeat protein
VTDETRRDDEEPKTDGAPPAERMDLPKWSRARVKRAQPEAEAAAAPDAFQQGVREAGRTAVRRGPLVLGGIVLVAAAIAGGIWWSGARAETVASGTRLLAQPLAWRARGQITDVDRIMKDRPRPPPVPIARDQAELDRNVDTAMTALAASDNEQAVTLGLLVRGATAMEKADFAGAQTAYEQFVTKVGTGHHLSFAAIEGIALAKEAQADTDGAIAELDKLAGAVGDFYRDMALWHKARILEALGRKDEALEVYKLYATEYPLDKSSLARNEVRARLSELDPSLVPAEPDASAAGLSGLLGP